MIRPLDVKWVGRIDYQSGLEMQEGIVAQLKEGTCTDTLLLLEHEPVYTIGRTNDQSSLLNPGMLPHPVVQINRGGQATYHGPGQLVGYPLIDLKNYRNDLHIYLRLLEGILIDALSEYSINAQRREGLTGVWIEDRKIASIGVGVRNWITMHGWALNVSGSLDAFASIVPCGIAGVSMTSIAKESSHSPTVQEVGELTAEILQKRLPEMLPKQ